MPGLSPHAAPEKGRLLCVLLLAGDGRALLLWGVPATILLISPLIGSRYLVLLWPLLLSFMGIACVANASRCGRIHCYLTGPFFLVLAIAAVLHGIEVIPLGEKGWWILSVVLVIGGAVLTWVPEWLLGRYRSPTDKTSCA
jgi:hypothetical protein